MACLLLKTTCDCISRITLFSVFMYVQNEGQFSTKMTLIAYYSVFFILMIFNTWINKNKNFWSAKNLLGITKQYNTISSIYILHTSILLQESFSTHWVQFSHTTTSTLILPSLQRRVYLHRILFIISDVVRLKVLIFAKDPRELLGMNQHLSNKPCTFSSFSCWTSGK